MLYNTNTFKEEPIISTRSRIGLQLSDGSVLSVYHHWDSYPSWLGRILNTHYNTKNKVAELIDGGDMSKDMWSLARDYSHEMRSNIEARGKHITFCEKYWKDYDLSKI